MSEQKLLPCPFCGSKKINYYYEGSHDHVFKCLGCDGETVFYVPHIGNEAENARSKWNSRTK